MRKKTTRKTIEQNKWRLPKWGTPIVERWFSDCMDEQLHLSRKQAEEMIKENARIGEPIITPGRQFAIIVMDFIDRLDRLEKKLSSDDVFFKALFKHTKESLKEKK